MKSLKGSSTLWQAMIIGLAFNSEGMCSSAENQENPPAGDQPETVVLPKPRYSGDVSIESALQQRRSVRQFSEEPLTLDQLSQLLWAAQGITHASGFRTAPSAGALYPLEVYIAVGNIHGVAEGVYRYQPEKHEIIRMASGDRRQALAQAALNQDCVRTGAAVLVLAALYERTTRKYGERGIRYVHIEIGHVAQNVYLQAVALGLGTVMVGAFDDEEVKAVLGLEKDEQPLGLMPIGRLP